MAGGAVRNMARQRYYRPSARCCRVLRVSADRTARPGPHTRGKPRLLDVGRGIPARDRFAPDSPLEGDGFERSVPRRRSWPPWPLNLLQPWIFQVSFIPSQRCQGPQENSGRIGGFEKGEFERHRASKKVAAQICVRRADTVQRARTADLRRRGLAKYRRGSPRRHGSQPPGDGVDITTKTAQDLLRHRPFSRLGHLLVATIKTAIGACLRGADAQAAAENGYRSPGDLI